MPFEPPMANGEDSDMMFLNVDMGDEDMGEDNMTDLLIGDMFNNMWAAGSPRRTDDDPAGSPQAHHHHQAAFHHQDDNTTVRLSTYFVCVSIVCVLKRSVVTSKSLMAGGGGCAAAAAPGAGLHGVDGPAGRHAGVVVGGLRAPARRLPRLPQDGAAPARRLAAGRRRLHVAHAAPRPQHAPARLADHHRRAQVLMTLSRCPLAGLLTVVTCTDGRLIPDTCWRATTRCRGWPWTATRTTACRACRCTCRC